MPKSFLCANGHEWEAPAEATALSGACPHCGVPAVAFTPARAAGAAVAPVRGVPGSDHPSATAPTLDQGRLADSRTQDTTLGDSPHVRPAPQDPTLPPGDVPVEETRLANLLSMWQAGQQQGQDTPPAELCRDCPELAAELERRIRALRQLNRLAGGLDRSAQTAPTLGPEESAPVPLSAAITVPGYEILGVLGRGGMGVVYQARQKGLNRLVALKMILAGAHASLEHLARFRAEAEAVASLQHPNIVQVYDTGEHEGRSYFSLEYVDGGSLAQKLGGAPQQPRQAATLVQALARAVHYAHERGIVHRDLKPANVLLTSQGTPKVTDFGLARRLDEDGQTRTGDVMGTPSYMAPEQAHGKVHEIGPPADIYALGVILYECLTGRPPFRGATLLETLEQVRSAEPVGPRRLQPSVPRDLETICLKCLDKDPRKRYASATELADDLRRFLASEPIKARPATRGERAWKWARRRPAVAALSAALVITLVAGFAGITAKYLEAENLRQKAEAARKEADAKARSEKEARVAAEQAKDQASQAEKQARAEALQRKYVSDFLTGLFDSNDPMGLQGYGFRTGDERGQNLTARELLLRGAKHIGSELGDQPVVRAALMDTIGNAHRGLGLYTEAEKLLKEALKLRRRHLGNDHPDVATSLHNLGWLYHDRGDYARGESYYRQALDLRTRKLGPEDAATATTMLHLAWLLNYKGDNRQAEKLYREGLAIRRKVFGDDHRDVAIAQVGLAALLLEEWRQPEALPLIQQATKTFSRREADRSITVIATKFQQAVVAQYFGNFKGAARLLEEVRDGAAKVLGDDHPYMALMHYQLAVNYESLREFQRAEDSYRTSLEVGRKAVGLEHPKTLYPVQKLAELLARRGKRLEGEKLFEELLEARRKRFGNVDVFVAEALDGYASYLDRRGDTSRAEALFREALDIFRRVEVYRVTPLANTVSRLGRILRARGQLAQAEKTFCEVLAPKKTLPALHPRAGLVLREQLVGVLVEQNKFAEAKPYLADLLALHRGQKTSGVDLMQALTRVGRICCEVGEFAEAEKAFREGVALARTLFAETPAKTVPHEEDLARALLGKGEQKEALAVLSRTAEFRLERPSADPSDLATTLRRLALAQRAAGDEDGCRRTATRLCERLAETKDGCAAALVVRTCTLMPGGSEDPARLIALAEHAVKGNPSPANLAALGAVLCRAGRLPEAITRLEEAHTADAQRTAPQAALFLALACNRLNQAELARKWLQTASAAMRPGARAGLLWEDRLEQDLLLREVQGLVK
jgi:tetratricopeptide (TPR) repeat protein